jgi:hypothetical protein
VLSSEHEGVLVLIRNRPALAPELVAAVLGESLPAFTEARLAASDLTEERPAAWHVDAVIELRGAGETTAGAIVVEVQRAVDQRKKYTWPVYVASVRAALECPVTLLVVATTPQVAEWARVPIELGRAGQITAVVLDYESVPAVESVAEAASDPELAVLSAMAHAGRPRERAVAEAAIGGIARVLDVDRRDHYLSMVLRAMWPTMGSQLEGIMGQHQELSDFEKRAEERGEVRGEVRGEARGEVRGRVESLLRVLTARGITVSKEARAAIVSCTDPAVLDRWLDRAVTAATLDDVFAG